MKADNDSNEDSMATNKNQKPLDVQKVSQGLKKHYVDICI